jgi:hypothetical protein
MNSQSSKGYSKMAANATIISVIGTALFPTSITLSLPHYKPLARAHTQNNQATSSNGANNTGIGNVNTILKIANLPPGNNTQIIMKNKNIANPNANTLKGMEKSQLGNVIPGKQGTTFEGQQLGNNTSTGNAGNNMTPGGNSSTAAVPKNFISICNID